MSPTGPNYAGTASTVSGSNNAWSNPSNATGAPNASYASASLTAGGIEITNPIKLTNFGFSIPSFAIIDGIYVEFDRYGNSAETASIQLLKAGSLVGSAKGQAYTVGDVWSQGTEAFVGYGASNDLWGTTWAYSDINNTNFGVEIVAESLPFDPGGNTAYIDAVRITIYWHTAPTNIPQQKTYLYKVYDSQTGNYLGNLPTPSTPFAVSQDINTAGAQITIQCAVSADTSALPSSPLLDETGANITDENSNNITDEGTAPYTGISTSQALIRDGNTVKIYEFGYFHPNGICLFSGVIDRHTDNFGGDTGDNNVEILVYHDGQDMDDFLIDTSPNIDQSQTSFDQSYLLNFSTSQPQLAQSISPGVNVNNISRATFKMATVTSSSLVSVTASLYASSSTGISNLAQYAANDTPTATSTQIINSTTATDYDFVFDTTFPSGEPDYYIIALSCSDPNGVYVSYQDSNVYAGGAMLDSYGFSGDLYFITYDLVSSTSPSFTSEDPSNMLLNIVDGYGGKITATESSVQATGLSLTYDFTTNTTYEGVQAALTLAPNGFYYYVDLGTDILYFQKVNTTADIVLTKGVHINQLSVVSTSEYVVNACYVVGGEDVNNPGFSVYTLDTDQDSISLYGQRLQIHTDNNITDTATAHVVGSNIVDANKDEQYQTKVAIVDKSMDITLLKPGLVVGFNGFGNYVDYLLAEIVHIDYTPSQAVCTLGILPKRTTIDVEKVTRGLVSLSTITNPSTPS